MRITSLKVLLENIKNSAFKWPEGESVEISLQNEILTRDEIQELIKILKNNNCNLKELKLKNCALDSQDIQVIMDALENRSSATLNVLDLSENRVGDEGAKIIANALKKNSMPNLKTITLNHAKMGDAGVKAIANAISDTISSNGPFKTVSFVGNYISLNAADNVVDILSQPYKSGRVNFYIDVATAFTSEYEDFQEKIFEKLDLEQGRGAPHKSVTPIYNGSEWAIFLQEYRGQKIRTLRTVPNTSLMQQFEQKIQYLETKFGKNEENQKLIVRLKHLYNTAKNDIDTKISKINWLDLEEEGPKLSQSSAMIVLRATDQMLEKFLKEGQDFNLVSSLQAYYKDCEPGTRDWTFWQTLVAGIIMGVITFFVAVNPIASPPVLSLIKAVKEISEDDPKFAFYLTEQLLHKSLGTKGMFFSPYSKLVSDIGKAAEHTVDEKATSGDNQRQELPKKTVL
jgi:hypothetical protein